MKHLLKGQIPKEYQLDYEITFTEQSATIYEKLIPELRRLMAGHFNPSVTQLSNWLHSIHKHRRDRIQKRNSGKLTKVNFPEFLFRSEEHTSELQPRFG